jgi:hypothetical protein
MDKDLLELEEELRSFAPRAMSAKVVSRMVSAMESWEESEEISAEKSSDEVNAGKVVAFPSHSSHHQRRSSWHPTWAAAAAVAIVGAVGAVMVPKSDSSGAGVTAMSDDLGPVPLLRQASFVPVKAERKVSSMDAGVISDRQGTPYQVLRVTRQEEANFEGDDNVGLKISRPKVDYFVVPVSY